MPSIAATKNNAISRRCARSARRSGSSTVCALRRETAHLRCRDAARRARRRRTVARADAGDSGALRGGGDACGVERSGERPNTRSAGRSGERSGAPSDERSERLRPRRRWPHLRVAPARLPDCRRRWRGHAVPRVHWDARRARVGRVLRGATKGGRTPVQVGTGCVALGFNRAFPRAAVGVARGVRAESTASAGGRRSGHRGREEAGPAWGRSAYEPRVR